MKNLDLVETPDALVFSLPGETNESIAVDRDASGQQTSPVSKKQQAKSKVNSDLEGNGEVVKALLALSDSMQYLGDEGKAKLRDELVVKTLEEMPNLEAVKHLSEVVASLVEKEKEPVKVEIDPVEFDVTALNEELSTVVGSFSELLAKHNEKEANQTVRYELTRNEKNLITSITKYVV